MEASRWEQIADLYQEACEREPADRIAFVNDASLGDNELRLEVESLLKQDISQVGALERAAEDANYLLSAATRKLPAAIGRYRILSLIGEGGMGLVYEAEQDLPRRTVALKVMKAGLASAESLWRFDLEATALGRLQHPGIARIYDAGTAEIETGLQPYFAMEFIHGSTILDDAQGRNLNTREKLEILALVADAVQHAHQRGIIHRDLKPSNILVDENGQPKILDFGVALLTDAQDGGVHKTDLGELVGTLAYMSPEQVSGDSLDVDARSDIYTLGVILYELLAGKLPYNVSRKLYDSVRVIREEQPTPIGHLNRAFRGDLEIIVAKSLEKDRSQRYSSAAEFAADIRRYLKVEPILARPPSLHYQLRKFAGRHKAFAVSTSTAFVLLLLGIAATANQSIRANRAEHAALIARDRATDAERRADADRDRALRSEGTATQERNRALEEKQSADTQAAIATAVSDFLQRDVLSQAGASTQASSDTKPDPDLKVRTALDRAAARIPSKFGNQPEVEASLRQTMGAAYEDLGLYPEARHQLESSLALQRQVLKPGDPTTLRTMESLAQLSSDQGNYAEAETLFKTILDQNRRLTKDPLLELNAITGLAEIISARGDYPRAAAMLETALNSTTRGLGPEHPAVLDSMTSLTTQYANQGEFARGAKIQERVFEIKKRTLGPEHPQTLDSMDNLAYQYRMMGDYARAEPIFLQALAIERRVLGSTHPTTLLTMKNLGRLYYAQKHYPQAEQLITESLEGVQRVLGEGHVETLQTRSSLAAVYWREGKFDQAEALFNKNLEMERRLLPADDPETVVELTSLSGMDLERKAYGKAEPLLREAVKAQEKTARPWVRDYTRAMLGRSLAGQGRYEEAETLMLSSRTALVAETDTIPAENRTILDRISKWIVEMYEAWGRPEKAAAWRDSVPKP